MSKRKRWQSEFRTRVALGALMGEESSGRLPAAWALPDDPQLDGVFERGPRKTPGIPEKLVKGRHARSGAVAVSGDVQARTRTTRTGAPSARCASANAKLSIGQPSGLL